MYTCMRVGELTLPVFTPQVLFVLLFAGAQMYSLIGEAIAAVPLSDKARGSLVVQ